MENKDSTSQKLLEYGLKAALVVGAVYGLRQIYKHYQKDKTEQQVEEKPEVRQAMSIYSAMNPSGMDWMKKMDGTNTQAVFSTAKEITDLNKVQSAYRKLYNSSMLDDLRQELSPEDYTKCLNTVKFNDTNIVKPSNKPKVEYKRGTLIATKLAANLRKTPQNISKWSLNSNIIKLADSGKFIGFTTGKTAFDNSGASETGTFYIELQSVAVDTKKPIFYWVAASQVKVISKEEYKSKKYPFMVLNEKETLKGFDIPQTKVVAYNATPVMDAKFQLIGIAYPLQVLGYSIMELRDNKGNEYVKFLNDRQKEHWVNKKFVQLIK
jgi:hypothetical protein